MIQGGNPSYDPTATTPTRGLRRADIGIKKGNLASSGFVVSWSTETGHYTAVESAPILKGSNRNKFCFSECTVEIILDLESSPKKYEIQYGEKWGHFN